MIKINLLAEGKRPTAVRRAKEGPVWKSENAATWMLVVGLLLPLLAAGVWWLQLGNELEEKQAAVAEAEKTVEELQVVLQEVEEFKAKKAELEHKIEVINQLKLNQRGPVKVMDYVSRALPELLWLDKMTMRPNQISLAGRAFNLNAIANFIENLDRVPEFKEPVLKDSNQRGRVYNYSIDFGYDLTPLAPEAEGGEVLTPTAGG